MMILRRIFREPHWLLYNGGVKSAVFQLLESDGIYYWVRADCELQDEDVPILELDAEFLKEVNTPDLPVNPKGRYCFLAKDEHFLDHHKENTM